MRMSPCVEDTLPRAADCPYFFIAAREEHIALTETPGAVRDFEANAVSLYDFHTIPEFRGRRVYQALLSRILARRFAQGAARAYITVLLSNTPSRVAIERVGFQLIREHHYRRLLKRASVTSRVPQR